MSEASNARKLQITSVDMAPIVKLGGVVGCAAGLLGGLGFLAHYGANLPAGHGFDTMAVLIPLFGAPVVGIYGLILGAIAGVVFNVSGGVTVNVADGE